MALVGVGGLWFGGEAAAQAGPPPVDVATPKSDTIVDWDEFTGRFVAAQRVEIRARVSGYLTSVPYEEDKTDQGAPANAPHDNRQRVTKDATLFKIDPRPFQAALRRAEADLKAAEADALRAQRELDRAEQLVENRTVAGATLDERRAARDRANAQVDAAKAQIETAKLDLEFATIKAPFDGLISDSRVDAGNLVEGGAGQAAVLAVLVQTKPILFEFSASEKDFLKYARLAERNQRPSSTRVRNPVYVKLRDETEFTRKGFMSFVDIEIDPNSGTIRGKATFDNEEGYLTPGLFGRLRLIGSAPYKALLVPDLAILSDQDRKMVMTVNDQNIVQPKIVRLGPIYRGLRVIRAGLEPGDRVIVAGLLRARPGGEVTPNPVEIEFRGPALEIPPELLTE